MSRFTDLENDMGLEVSIALRNKDPSLHSLLERLAERVKELELYYLVTLERAEMADRLARQAYEAVVKAGLFKMPDVPVVTHPDVVRDVPGLKEWNAARNG